MKIQNYYTVLGIDRRASGDEIKHAYRRLAQRFHPDVTSDPDGESKFKAVAEAYRTLRHADTRTAYDRRTLPGDGGGEFCWKAPAMSAWFALFQWPDWVWAGFWPG